MSWFFRYYDASSLFQHKDWRKFVCWPLAHIHIMTHPQFIPDTYVGIKSLVGLFQQIQATVIRQFSILSNFVVNPTIDPINRGDLGLDRIPKIIGKNYSQYRDQCSYPSNNLCDNIKKGERINKKFLHHLSP